MNSCNTTTQSATDGKQEVIRDLAAQDRMDRMVFLKMCFILLWFPTMGNYISHLAVSLDETEEQNLQSQGYNKIHVDLNKGARGKYIYIWYKKETSQAPITRIQFTFNDDMSAGLINAGYTKIPKDLNAGAEGDYIYLWYYRGSTEFDTRIVDIDVTTDAGSEAQKFSLGWEKLTCDLNRKAKGDWIHTWVKRAAQTYICDVIATNSFGSDAEYFNRGYIRLDEDTNRDANGAYVFIWYRQTTDSQRALTDLQISTSNSERQALQQQNYQPVSVNLNEGTGGDPVYLWHKRDQWGRPIKAIAVLFNMDAVPAYERSGINVIKKDLNRGNKGSTEYLCVSQREPEKGHCIRAENPQLSGTGCG